MAEQSQATTQKSRLDQLVAKYGYTQREQRTPVQSVFERSDMRQSRATLERISAQPTTSAAIPNASDIIREQASIDLKYADILESYGKMNTSFFATLKKSGFLGPGQWIKWRGMQVIGKKEAARDYRADIITGDHRNLEMILNMLGDLANEIYQNRIKAEDLARQTQMSNMQHMKTLYRSLIKEMKDARFSVSDQAEAEAEVRRFEGELREVDGVLQQYETDINTAKAENKIDDVKRLTDEMTQVVDMREAIMDGQFGAENANLEIRRSILDASEGVRVAKEAIIVSQASYQMINALIDTAAKHKIMYKHYLEKMHPALKIQGQVSVQGREALRAQEALSRVYGAMTEHIDANARMGMHLVAKATELLHADKIDREGVKKVTEMMRGYLDETNRKDMEWAQKQQTLSDMLTTETKAQYVTRK